MLRISAHEIAKTFRMQSARPMLAAVAVLATAAALAPTVDRRTALALPLAVVPVAAKAATDDVIVSGTVNAADAVVGPDAALYVTMRRGGARKQHSRSSRRCPSRRSRPFAFR